MISTAAEVPTAEFERQTFNQEVINRARLLSGRLAQDPSGRSIVGDPDFEFSQLSFTGDDPRSAELEELVNIFTNRSKQLLERRARPGATQTRLSLIR